MAGSIARCWRCRRCALAPGGPRPGPVPARPGRGRRIHRRHIIWGSVSGGWDVVVKQSGGRGDRWLAAWERGAVSVVPGTRSRPSRRRWTARAWRGSRAVAAVGPSQTVPAASLYTRKRLSHSLSHGVPGESLVPPYTRGSVSLTLSLTGSRAKAWCLLIHAEASLTLSHGVQSLAPPYTGGSVPLALALCVVQRILNPWFWS